MKLVKLRPTTYAGILIIAILISNIFMYFSILGTENQENQENQEDVSCRTPYQYSNPQALMQITAPSQISVFDDGGSATGLCKSGNLLFVADGTDGIEVLNVSNLANPQKIANYSNGLTATAIWVENDLAYVTFLQKDLEILNISDLNNITLLGEYDAGGIGTGGDIFQNNDFIYLADGVDGVKIINISTLATPILQSTYDSLGMAVELTVLDTTLYLADTGGGLISVNITNSSDPQEMDDFRDTVIAESIGVAILGDIAYVADGTNGLLCVNISDPLHLDLERKIEDGVSYQAVDISNDLLAVIDGGSGVHFYNISNSTDPTPVGADFSPGFTGQDLILENSIAFLANTDNGIEILDVGFDTDEDDLSDAMETYVYFTETDNNDTDADGISDGAEVWTYATDPLSNDTDLDGLGDGDEILVYGTNAALNDTEGDGVMDGEEVLLYNSNPLSNDSDFDNMPDGWEIFYYPVLNATDPTDNVTDYDLDLLQNVLEYQANTNPTIADTDGDGLGDGAEVLTYKIDPLCNDSDTDGLLDGEEVGLYSTNPGLNDTDRDGLFDYEEIMIYETSAISNDTDGDGLADRLELFEYFTNPTTNDTDQDLLTDAEEVFVYFTNPTCNDTDHDGLLDGSEVNQYSTNPIDWDTDGDWYSDSSELLLGKNPLNPLDNIAYPVGSRINSSQTVELNYECNSSLDCAISSFETFSILFEIIGQNSTHLDFKYSPTIWNSSTFRSFSMIRPIILMISRQFS
jgi:hypothetical protein